MSNEPIPLPPKNTINIRARMNPREICFLTDILEGYPGYAVLRTDDAKKGLVQIWIAPDFYTEVMEILEDLKVQLNFTVLKE